MAKQGGLSASKKLMILSLQEELAHLAALAVVWEPWSLSF